MLNSLRTAIFHSMELVGGCFTKKAHLPSEPAKKQARKDTAKMPPFKIWGSHDNQEFLRRIRLRI